MLDNAFQAFFCWQFLLFALGIYAITFVIRTIIEYFCPKFSSGKMWNSLILILLPLVIGWGVSILSVHFAYPPGIESASSRQFFGFATGLFSGTIYKIAKGILKNEVSAVAANINNVADGYVNSIK